MALTCPVDLDVASLQQEAAGPEVDVSKRALRQPFANESPALCWKQSSLVGAFQAAGFEDVRTLGRFDCFAATSKERTARRYGVAGVNLAATWPG